MNKKAEGSGLIFSLEKTKDGKVAAEIVRGILMPVNELTNRVPWRYLEEIQRFVRKRFPFTEDEEINVWKQHMDMVNEIHSLRKENERLRAENEKLHSETGTQS